MMHFENDNLILNSELLVTKPPLERTLLSGCVHKHSTSPGAQGRRERQCGSFVANRESRDDQISYIFASVGKGVISPLYSDISESFLVFIEKPFYT